MSIASALSEWSHIVGETDVLHGDRLVAAMPACTTGARRQVPALIRLRRASENESEEQFIDSRLIPVLRVAARHRVPLHPISTGRNWGYGSWLPPGENCAALDLSAIRRIRHFDPITGSVVLEPGVTQQQLSEFLLNGGHPFMVPVTGAGPECSLLANALERGYGITPTSDHFAAVQSLEAVLADGSVYRSPLEELCGRHTVPGYKWGIGAYMDGLFAQNALGVVTAMRIALVRRPEVVRVFVAPISATTPIESVVRTVREIKSTLPGLVGGINLLNARRTLAMVAPYPWDELGANGVISDDALARMQQRYGVTPWTLFGTVYGTRQTAAAAQREIARLCRPAGIAARFFSSRSLRGLEQFASRVPVARIKNAVSRRVRMLRTAAELAEGYPNQTALPLAYWRNRTAPTPGEALDPARDGCGLIWYAPLIPMHEASVARFIDFVSGMMIQYGLEPLITLTTMNEQCFDSSVPLLFDRGTPGASDRAQACCEALIQRGITMGFLPYRLPIDAIPLLERYNLSHSALVGRLMRAVDPQGLLSPGKYRAPQDPQAS